MIGANQDGASASAQLGTSALAPHQPIPTDDLSLPLDAVAKWFDRVENGAYSRVRVSSATVETWSSLLALALRRCYVKDDALRARVLSNQLPVQEVLAAFLPSVASTQSGDFGEVLAYLYLSSRALPRTFIGPKKWRHKANPDAPMHGSDVVLFHLSNWPLPSSEDVLVCAEVKSKATQGAHRPAVDAVHDLEKDRTSRLAKTLTWMKRRAITTGLDDIHVSHIERFERAIEHPAARREFVAACLYCDSLVDADLSGTPLSSTSDVELVVISVPDLRGAYSDIFSAALTLTLEDETTPGDP